MKIGFLLLTSPENQNSFTVASLSEAFLTSGDDVHIFVADDGLYNLVKGCSRANLFADLLTKGAKISMCAQTGKDRKLSTDTLIDGINSSSLYTLAQVAGKSDRFLSFSI